MSDSTHDLMVRGRSAVKAGEIKEARFFLEWCLRQDPPRDEYLEALYWMSRICADPVEKRRFLEDILANDLGNARARRDLMILDGKLDPQKIIDPDRMPAPVKNGLINATADRFTCPRCGGRMSFAPDGETLTCEYCEAQESLKRPTQEVGEDNFLVDMVTARGHLKPVDTRITTCQGCGARFILPPTRMTLTCPYCGSGHIIEQTDTVSTVIPNGIIPFRISELKARLALRDWFANDPLPEKPLVARGHGVYLPTWTFDIGGQTSWSCEIEVNNRSWIVQTGDHPVHYNDVLVTATRKLPPPLIPAMATFDLKTIRPYDARYLANWLAETYEITIGDASLSARQVALKYEKQAVLAAQEHPTRNLVIRTAGMIVESYKLILLPVWLTHYTCEGKRYEVLVNGYDGTIYGERPHKGLVRWLDKLFG